MGETITVVILTCTRGLTSPPWKNFVAESAYGVCVLPARIHHRCHPHNFSGNVNLASWCCFFVVTVTSNLKYCSDKFNDSFIGCDNRAHRRSMNNYLVPSWVILGDFYPGKNLTFSFAQHGIKLMSCILHLRIPNNHLAK